MRHLTDWQYENLLKIEACVSDNSMTLKDISKNTGVSIETLKNWREYGYLETVTERRIYAQYKKIGRKKILVIAVRWPQGEG